MAAGDAMHPKVAAATIGGLGTFSVVETIVQFLDASGAFKHLTPDARTALEQLIVFVFAGLGTVISGYMRSAETGLNTQLDKAITAVGAKFGLSSTQLAHVKQTAETDLQSAMDKLSDYVTQATTMPTATATPEPVAFVPPVADPVLDDADPVLAADSDGDDSVLST